MKLSEYMKLSREERTAHADLSSPCDPFHRQCRRRTRKVLLAFFGLIDDKPKGVACCHLCDCNSVSETPCLNPLHLYFGTVSENTLDMGEKLTKKASKGGVAVHAKKDSDGKSVRGKELIKFIPVGSGGKAVHAQKNEEGKSIQGIKLSQNLRGKWRCKQTGRVLDAGNLTQYQRRNGIDTSLRERVNTPDNQA